MGAVRRIALLVFIEGGNHDQAIGIYLCGNVSHIFNFFHC
jgi:hypothetical protein